MYFRLVRTATLALLYICLQVNYVEDLLNLRIFSLESESLRRIYVHFTRRAIVMTTVPLLERNESCRDTSVRERE